MRPVFLDACDFQREEVSPTGKGICGFKELLSARLAVILIDWWHIHFLVEDGSSVKICVGTTRVSS